MNWRSSKWRRAEGGGRRAVSLMANGKWQMANGRVLLFCFLLSVFCLLVSGCGTVRAPALEDQQASFDGNEANSGFVGFTASGSGLITDRARVRYNALIGVYGKRFLPALEADEGLKAVGINLWEIDAEHLVRFATMNRWRKEGR